MRYEDFVWQMASEETKNIASFLRRCEKLDLELSIPTVLHATLGLSAEAAELREALVGTNRTEQLKELGDLLFYWTLAVRAFGFSIPATKRKRVPMEPMEHYTGNLCELVKKAVFQGLPFDGKNLEIIENDLIYIHAHMGNIYELLGVTEEEIIERNQKKLLKRYPEGKFSAFRSNNRES